MRNPHKTISELQDQFAAAALPKVKARTARPPKTTEYVRKFHLQTDVKSNLITATTKAK